ncbi:amidoligase family protein [Tepidamorphus sp. 3E244]|uniref:amidoligase family protein n=1 Tax=Tepidamorphus sp. 3E244 TaxID=3385498 RepID=UPI0038FC7840
MTEYEQPDTLTTASGETRSVGIEIEFADLTSREAAQVIQRALGGRIEEVTPHRMNILDTPIGNIRIELDTRFVHSDNPQSEPAILQTGRDILGKLSQALVPQELVTDPIPMDRIGEIDQAIEALRDAGAKGTGDNLAYAFGLHLNPQAASLQASYLLSIMRAFCALNAKLREDIHPDWTREMMSWARPYTPEYQALILDPAYNPDTSTLIADYVRIQPNRNHDLDMLPIFAHLDPNAIKAKSSLKTVSGRPAFHYRLPDCRISEPGWNVAPDWNRWLSVERLAADNNALMGAIRVKRQTLATA